MYAKAGKRLYQLLKPLWSLRAHGSRRCRVWVEDDKGRVLLIKNWFGSQRWTLPGGGIRKGESAKHAAVRELKEEIRLVLTQSELQELGEFDAHYLEIPFKIVALRVKTENEQPVRNRFEVVAMEWFEADDLPAGCSPVVTQTKQLTTSVK